MVLLFILLLWSRFCHLLIVSRLLSLGLGSCLVFKPFKPRPVFGFCMCSSLFCVWFVSSPPVFLLFSLSLRRWGNPNPLWGVWGSPCVLFLPHTLSFHDPYFKVRTYTKASPRSCLFFFPFVVVVVARFRFGVCSSLSCGCRFFLVGVFSASGLCFSLCASTARQT